MGERFGPYELVRLLGRGGMGEVWAAFDTEQERTVALKRLLPHLADDEEFQKRFRRESRLAARLSSPHVIPIHRSGEIDGRLFIDMRLVEGHDLEQLLARDAHLEPARAVTVVEHVAGALDAAHHAGLIHRDVKPSNVLLDGAVGAHGFVYLVDFGITRTFGEQSHALTATHSVVGSLDYMAPEQFEGAVEPSIDVYALGCLLFQSLTGGRPFPVEGFPALMRAHLTLPAPAPSTLRPALGAAFDDVVASALAKDPGERYPSAGALAAAARGALEAAAGAGTDRWTEASARPGAGTERRPVASPPGIGGPRSTPSRSEPATEAVGLTAPAEVEPATSTMAPAGDPVTSTMAPPGPYRPRPGTPLPAHGAPRRRPTRPPPPSPAPPVRPAHPSFPYPPGPPSGRFEGPPPEPPSPEPAAAEVPEEAVTAAPSGSAGTRLLLAAILVGVLVIGVLVGRLVVVWVTTGASPLTLGAPAAISMSAVDATHARP